MGTEGVPSTVRDEARAVLERPRKGREGWVNRRREGRPTGFGVVEVLVAFLLLLLLVQGAWWVAGAQRRALRALTDRGEVLSAGRIVRAVLGSETRAGLAGRDWRVEAPGVLRLRAFRGWAVVCPGIDPRDSLAVRTRGWRVADPSKDSVLVLTREGRWLVAALAYRHRDPTACARAEPSSVEVWRLDPPVPDAVVLRFFESGSYHLTDGSLRYRRGAGGRQPLTGASLDPAWSGVDALEDGRARLRVRGRTGGGWSRPLGRAPQDSGGMP